MRQKQNSTQKLIKSTVIRVSVAVLMSAALTPSAYGNSAATPHPEASSPSASGGGTILGGIIDLPREAETAPIDGCAKVQTGLTIGGGFMLFTCEKLRPFFPISEQDIVAKRYHTSLQAMGWTRSKTLDDGTQFTKRDEFGCTAKLSVRVWKDRAINETILHKTRDSFRQIVFTANYNGAACERYYPTVQAMKRQNNQGQFAAR